MSAIIVPIVISILTVGFVFILIKKIRKSPSGEGKMIEIQKAIREGATSYLKRQYKAVSIVAVVLFLFQPYPLSQLPHQLPSYKYLPRF